MMRLLLVAAAAAFIPVAALAQSVDPNAPHILIIKHFSVDLSTDPPTVTSVTSATQEYNNLANCGAAGTKEKDNIAAGDKYTVGSSTVDVSAQFGVSWTCKPK